MANSLQYLARVISTEYNNPPAVVRNLSRTRLVWKRMTRISSKEGAEPRVSGLFLKAVVQTVLLFGSETWVVTPRTGRALGILQEQVER